MSRDVVVLDVDGTLVDSTYLHAIAWARAFAAYDLAAPTWRVHRAIGMGGDRLVAEVLGEDAERAHGDDLRERWRQEYEPLRGEARPFDGAERLIRQLRNGGFLVALASSGEREFVDEAVERLGVADALEAVVSSDDAEESKPEPDVLEAALRASRAERAVMVGDSVYDVDAASRAGLRCITFRTGGFGEAELYKAGAATVVDGPREAIGLDWLSFLGYCR
ncbi:HAD family hydrolase [Calidifontibacter sp. DB0510]|uniref:HAD family hydrolase n=1 Tax=Metallococcus carri TaxID=1656884 RepID=A0A967E9D1_9MICO|nr:HAD family hydrolase [Metallococcus carri]NHN54739.1 HAD family hydrolase [Metallococcus carri]NOP37084.1 HAD family hydrolase [Calidifontibacter sp. DB2511S]